MTNSLLNDEQRVPSQWLVTDSVVRGYSCVGFSLTGNIKHLNCMENQKTEPVDRIRKIPVISSLDTVFTYYACTYIVV